MTSPAAAKAKKAGIWAFVAASPLLIGVIVAGVGPGWRVDSVDGATVTCHQRFRTDHTKTVKVSNEVAKTVHVDDTCPG
jgi:hypothetical protein